MHTFKDSQTDHYWQLDEAVRVEVGPNGREFFAESGQRLNVPSTLEPAELPAPELVPVSSVPSIVTSFQAMASLSAAGKLDVVDAIFSNTDTPLLHRLAYQRSPFWERNSALVAYMAASLGWDDASIDRLFADAVAVEG